jgi:hypothetical protein
MVARTVVVGRRCRVLRPLCHHPAWIWCAPPQHGSCPPHCRRRRTRARGRHAPRATGQPQTTTPT